MKQLVATALAVSVALCLAACGNTQSGAESTDGSTTAEAGTVWKIGGIGPVTGSRLRHLLPERTGARG